MKRYLYLPLVVALATISACAADAADPAPEQGASQQVVPGAGAGAVPEGAVIMQREEWVPNEMSLGEKSPAVDPDFLDEELGVTLQPLTVDGINLTFYDVGSYKQLYLNGNPSYSGKIAFAGQQDVRCVRALNFRAQLLDTHFDLDTAFQEALRWAAPPTSEDLVYYQTVSYDDGNACSSSDPGGATGECFDINVSMTTVAWSGGYPGHVASELRWYPTKISANGTPAYHATAPVKLVSMLTNDCSGTGDEVLTPVSVSHTTLIVP